MAVTSITDLAPAVGQRMPDTIVRPAVTFLWAGGTGPFDIEVTWDDDSSFNDGNGNRQIVSAASVTSPQTRAPSSDLADLTVQWYIRIRVIDTADLQNEIQNILHDHTGGDFTASFDGQGPTAAITWDNDGTTINTELEAFSNIVAVTITENATGDWDVEFTDPGDSDLPMMTVDGTNLTGGTTIDVTEVTAGDNGLGGAGENTQGTFTYFLTNPIDRTHLYHYQNVGVAFDPQDEPTAGWGTGGTAGVDGENNPVVRTHLYHVQNIGVGYEKDKPAAGWGPNSPSTDAPDGVGGTGFDTFLYHYQNIDTTQPCPFMFSLSVAQAETGDSITVKGQGLVSATNPTPDAWDAEVRLYETPDFGASFVTLAITDWTAGDVEDQIIATIPGGATSGFIAVVHTTTPSCSGSNFLGLTVIASQPDRQAGWWAELWDLRNVTKIISPVPFVHEAGFEAVANDQGSGEIFLRGNDPDIDEFVDRSTNPEIQRLVKIYLHDRFAYSFIPDDSEEDYDEDGARTVRLYGSGQESILEWGRALWKDFPAQPAKNRTWQYGSTDNAVPWGDMEPDNVLTNGGFEDAQVDPWVPVETAALFADSSEANTGTYSGRVTPAALGDGIEISFSQEEDDGVFADLFTKVNLTGGTYEIEVLGKDEDDNDVVHDSFTWIPASGAWLKTELNYIAAASEQLRFRITQTAGTLTQFWVDDAVAHTSIDGTIITSRATARLSRTQVAAGVYSLEVACEAGGDSSFNGVQGFFSEGASQDYRLSVAVNGPAGDTVRFDARLGGVLVNATQVLTGGSTFDVITLVGTSGLTGGTGRFTVRSLESAALTFYMDELKILPGAAAANPGQIVIDVKTEMDLRGTLDFVILNFDGTRDTAGVPWPEELPFEVDPSWSLWDLLEKFIGMGYSVELAPVNWREGGDTGWELNMWAPLNAGVDWSLFDDGPAILPGDTVRDVEPSSAPPAETVVYGEGSGGIWTVATASAARITNLERREAFVKADHAKDTVTLFRVAQHRLTTSLQKGEQWTAKLTDDADPLPYFDFIPHDRLRAHLPSDDSGRDAVFDDTYLAAAITFRGTAAGVTQEYEVDFGRYKLHAQRLTNLILARQLQRESTENYQKGTGSVSSQGSAAVATSSLATTDAAGEVGAHPHVWADIEPAIGGDLAGSLPEPSVVGLRGRGIATNVPAADNVLAFKTATGLWTPSSGSGDWVTPTLLNSWVDFAGTFSAAQYRKDHSGVVHLKGLIKDGTTTGGTIIFTLPTGHRPADDEVFVVSISPDGASGRIDVDANGDVVVRLAHASYTSLNGIRFLGDGS